MIRIQRSVSYGPEIRQKMDIYRPWSKQPSGLPVLVYLHGGSWKSGTRNLYFLLGSALARLGFVVAVPDYRLFPEVRFPGFVEDSALATQWMYEHARDLGGDPSRVSLMGHSAGAHMGALLCVDPTYLAETPGLKIEKFVGLAGPYSSDLSTYDSVGEIFSHVEDTRRTRPIKMIPQDKLPTRFYLLHGEADTTVNKRNTLYMSEALSEAGADIQSKVYEDLGHVDIVLRLMPGLRNRHPIWPDIVRFMG
jgi:acetyl esterase/lipase